MTSASTTVNTNTTGSPSVCCCFSHIKKVEDFEDKIIEVCDEFGITPNVPVKGKQPGSRGKLTVKDIFGHDSEAEDDDDVQELGSEDDEDETDESVKEPRKKTLRMESDEDKKKKKKKKKSLGSFTIDLNINH